MTDQPNNPDYSASYIADAPKRGMTIAERLENAQKEALDAYSLAHKQAYVQFWEQRRYEASVAAMRALISGTSWERPDIVREAVKYADALIEELRKTQSGEQ